jgi:hypothetical protein
VIAIFSSRHILARRNSHSTGTAPSSYSLHFNDIQCFFCNIRTQMPVWKPKSKLAGRIFAILRLRLTINKEELSHLEPPNGLAGQDHLDLPASSRPLPISIIGSAATCSDPTISQSYTSPSLSDSSSSSEHPVHQAPNHQRYETPCSY